MFELVSLFFMEKHNGAEQFLCLLMNVPDV
jgi:hypothetical protein